MTLYPLFDTKIAAGHLRRLFEAKRREVGVDNFYDLDIELYSLPDNWFRKFAPPEACEALRMAMSDRPATELNLPIFGNGSIPENTDQYEKARAELLRLQDPEVVTATQFAIRMGRIRKLTVFDLKIMAVFAESWVNGCSTLEAFVSLLIVMYDTEPTLLTAAEKEMYGTNKFRLVLTSMYHLMWAFQENASLADRFFGKWFKWPEDYKFDESMAWVLLAFQWMLVDRQIRVDMESMLQDDAMRVGAKIVVWANDVLWNGDSVPSHSNDPEERPDVRESEDYRQTEHFSDDE
jgi:hypothetical protein